MSRLRIGLPPLDSLLGSETPEQCQVDFARLDRGGRITATGRCALQQLGRAGQGASRRRWSVSCIRRTAS